jgi:hypothetical protein
MHLRTACPVVEGRIGGEDARLTNGGWRDSLLSSLLAGERRSHVGS